MKVILLSDVKKVGQRGAVVTVADGYGQNVLIPKRLAVLATPENLKHHDKAVGAAHAQAEAGAQLAREMLAGIKDKTLEIHAKASETGTLFKSVHIEDITAAAKKEWGVVLPEAALTLPEPIKKTGTYAVSVCIAQAKATINVTVLA